ncbi:protocadherin Fat 4-like [Mercenaria mercenaria]|uniref:protocadherin Fat 4-like n=1 Tax=Mercenaria mercenaria TaxID=6596 RepID=UPI00234EFCC6|nr:protocadherin Fat 4-like [Mercenaria mercenaria]
MAGPGKLSFAIKDGNIHGKFGVNTTNDVGKVYVYQSISFESRTTRFQLSIEVIENGPVRSTTNFVLDIQITGINDYAPLFLFSPYTVYINEDKQPGSILFNPIPYDFDKGDDGATTSVILDGDDTLFYMDPSTAKVYLRTYLDYERKNEYVLTIQVTDNGVPQRRSSTTLLRINVKDINDNPPVCEESYVTETFDETKAAGSVIKFLRCTDADIGNNGRLSYTITEGDYTKFRLQGPYLVLSKEIDVDTEPNVWGLTVVVRDRGNPRLSTLIDIVIYVEGVDDNAPVWAPPENGRYVVDIEEHSSVGKLVVRVSADDLDSNDHDAVVVYYMDDYSRDIFLSQELDHEKGATYTIPVSAVSHNNPLDRVSTNVIINVIDVNDNTPEFDKALHISEALPAKTEIATVTATDSDTGPNGVIQYQIIGGNTDSLFDIHSKTGVISLMGKLDFERKNAHTVYLRASDKGRPTRWSTCTVIISVLPVNEFVPIFKEIATVLIPEDTTIGISVFTVSATDNDTGTDGTISYEIGPDEERFVIESRTGIVRLLQTLDRETEETFDVDILGTDMSESERKTGSVVVKVKVLDRNDNPPNCEMSFYSKKLIPPTSSGDVIQTLQCTDADAASNSKLSYTVISGNTNNDFSMSIDGSLVVMQKPSSPEYRLEIQVNDNGNPSLDTFVLIVIKIGGTPTIKNLPKKLQVSEGISIGSQIFQVKAESVSEQFEYFIKNITSDKKVMDLESPLVKIDKISGKVFTWRVFDREETDHYLINVGVKETVSGKQAESTIDITVLDENDNAPKFEMSFYNVSLMENIKVGTELIDLDANDADLHDNANIVFDITGGNIDNSFVIDKNGIVKTRTVVDRERNDFFTLIVTASDRGSIRHTGSATVLISVLDADEYIPTFINIGSDLETTLPEDTPIAAKVFAMKARDLDVHKKLTYDIDDISKEHFIIEKDSGEIFLSRLLDREKQDVHTLVVTAEGNGKAVSASVTLSVSDINDNDPIFSSNLYKFDVNERSKASDFVGLIEVTDADIGENALISTSVTKGNRGNVFVLRSNKLYVSGNLHFELINEYLLEIEARDNGSPQRTSTASVIIEVTPEYRIPKFAIDLEVIHISENVHVGNSVYDADGTLDGAREGHGNDLMYSIENGNENGLFSINWNTGEITVARKLDKTFDKDVFMLLLVSKNIYRPSLNDEMTLKIEIDDVNDNKPTFENSMYTLNINEDTKLGSNIGSVSATDLDRGQNSFITYELLKNEDAETFRIDPFAGTLSLKKELNFMYNTIYQLSVIAFDNGSPRLTGSTYVTVNIIDVNDRPPIFELESPSIKVRENYALGRMIYQIRAHDGDTGVGGELLYRIVHGNDNGTFELDSETGELTVAKELDRESEDLFIFVVEAEDKGVPSLTGTTTLSVILTDVNDNSPYFLESTYDVSLDRFSPVESHVISVTALDADAGDNALLEYQISEDNDELFQIDAKSGHVFTFSDLTEIENDISIIIVAKDRGIPRLSTSVTVLIEIHPPLVTETEDFLFEVSEYASPNTFVGAVGSSTSMSSSRYAIVSGNYKKHFRISEEDGNIFLNKVLDREIYTDYYLRVKSTHKLSQNIQTDIYVHVSVKDENDNFPQFEEQVYNILVLEHTPIGFSVASIVASDMDDGSNGKVTYSISNGKEGDANKIFSLNENGTLVVQSSISYEAVDHLNFTVVAKDNGQYSRQGSTQVNVQVVDIDENVVRGMTKASAIINLEMPVSASKNFVVGCIAPEMFGLNVSASKVNYIAQKQHSVFGVTRETGCITIQNDVDLEDGKSFFMWVVAVLMTPDKARGRLALVRVDTFFPTKHVVVFTHSVPKEVLELNRSLSYIYVIRDNETNSMSKVQNKKHFLMQSDILSVLRGPEDGVSHDLTSESFDNFPVVSVVPYKDKFKYKTPWIRSTTGKWILGVILSALIVGLIIAGIVFKTKKRSKSNIVNAERAPKPSLSVPPNTNKINPKYNNLRRSSSTADLIPLVNAMKILSGMTEEQRNKLIDTTLGANQSQTENEKNDVVFKPKFLTKKMKSVPLIEVSHLDGVNELRKIANDTIKATNIEAASKQSTKAPIISEPIAPFTTKTIEVNKQPATVQETSQEDANVNVSSLNTYIKMIKRTIDKITKFHVNKRSPFFFLKTQNHM